MMMSEYWMFGPQGLVPAESAPEGTNGAEIVRCTADEAARLSAVPEQFRWEAAQGEFWSPSPEYWDWLEK